MTQKHLLHLSLHDEIAKKLIARQRMYSPKKATKKNIRYIPLWRKQMRYHRTECVWVLKKMQNKLLCILFWMEICSVSCLPKHLLSNTLLFTFFQLLVHNATWHLNALRHLVKTTLWNSHKILEYGRRIYVTLNLTWLLVEKRLVGELAFLRFSKTTISGLEVMGQERENIRGTAITWNNDLLMLGTKLFK